jgi:putative endonuclease
VEVVSSNLATPTSQKPFTKWRAFLFTGFEEGKIADLLGSQDFFYLHEKMHFVYILFSPTYDKYYVGQTNSIEGRLKRHNEGYEGYTKPYRPWELVLVIEKESRADAMGLERKLKNLSKQRIKSFILKYGQI